MQSHLNPQSNNHGHFLAPSASNQSLNRFNLAGVSQGDRSSFFDQSTVSAAMKPHISYSNLNLSNQKSGNERPNRSSNQKQTHSFQPSQQNSSMKTPAQGSRKEQSAIYNQSLALDQSREESPEINRQLMIDQLLSEINKSALQMSKKLSLEDLSLMDLLNGFDIVVAEKRPRTDLANHVYRLILRNEREKQYSSIQDLSTEIKALKQFEKVEEEKASRVQPKVLQEIDKNTLNTTMFDFQGSFGEEESNKFFAQMNQENLKQKLKQKHNFPKFSLDKVLEIQKMESFQQRCNKLQKIEGQKKTKHNFKYNIGEQLQQNHMRTETPNFLNKDLEAVASKRSPHHQIENDYQATSINMAQQQIQGRLNLPKLNFSELLNSSPHQASKQRSQSVIPGQIHNHQYGNSYVNFAHPKRENSQFQERAIDSHRNVAFAYYTRRLLLTAWRSLYNFHLDTENKVLCRQLADQKYQKNAKRRIFRGLHQQAKQHYGHGRDNRRAVAIFQLRMATKYLQRWRQETHEQVIEKQKLMILQEHLKNVRRRQYFEKLRQAVMKQQMRAVQEKTAQHIQRQRNLRKVLLGLKYLVKFRRNLEYEHKMTQNQNRQRLLRKGVRGLIMFRIGSLKYRQDLDSAILVRNFNLMKLALKHLKEYHLKRQQFKSLLQYAFNFYKSEKLKQSFECLHKYTQLMKGVNRQKFFIDTYYQKKLKFNLFQYLMATNMVYLEKEENLVLMKQRLRQRKVLNALSKNRKESRVHRQPNKTSFYYAAYLWLQKSFDKLVEEKERIPNTVLGFNQFMQQSKVNYYKNLSYKAHKKLQAFYLEKILLAWKERTSKLRSLVQRRENKTKFNILRTLRLRSHTNGKYKFLLNKWLSNKNSSLIERVFVQLSRYANKQKIARMILSKVAEVKETRRLEKVMNALKLFAKRKSFRRNQKAIAVELSQQNAISKPFKLWRQKFLKISERADMKMRQLKFLRQRLLKKYFGQMHTEFWKINTKYDRQAKFYREQRRKTIKKVMCGFLQNILLNHKKRNELELALGHLKTNLLLKSLKSWQFMMPELRQKSKLFKLVKQDRQLKTLTSCFNGLKMYHSFKMNQKAVDHFMTYSLRLITQKRFFKSWTKSLNFKTSFTLIGKLFTQHRKQEFFTRVQKKKVFEVQVVKHMRLFQEFKLLEFTMMRGLKRNVDRRLEWLEIWDKIQENKLRYSKLHFLRKWMQEKRKIDRERKIVNFSIVQIKNMIMRKYFQVLKNRLRVKHVQRLAVQDKNFETKQKFFKGLKKIVQSRVNCKKQDLKIKKQKRRETLRNVLELWMNEIAELNALRNYLLRKQQVKREQVISVWRFQVQKNKQDRMKILHCFQISNYYRARLYLRMLYQNKQKQLLQRKLYQNLQRLINDNLMRSVISAARLHLSENRETIQKMQVIRRRVSQRVKKGYLQIWQSECHDSLTKLRVLKCLGVLNRNIELRNYLQRWVEYTEESQEIEEKGEKHLAFRVLRSKQDAIRKLREHTETQAICRSRMASVEAYWIKKTQMRFLTYLRCAVRILNRRKDNKSRAYSFLRFQMSKKALISFAIQTQKNAHFKELQNEFYRRQKLVKGPQVIQKLRNFTYASKERSIKTSFAHAFMSNKLYSQCFKGLLMHFLYRRDKRMRQSKAVFQRCEVLLRSSFEGIKSFTLSKRLLLEKRNYLVQVLSTFDQTQNLRLAFDGLKGEWQRKRDSVLQIRGLIALNQMKIVFSKLRGLSSKRKNLRKLGQCVSQKQKLRQARHLMHYWMRALGNEANIKVMERNRAKSLKLKAFNGLRRKHLIRRLQFRNLNSKAQSYSRICLNALIRNSQRQKKLRSAQSDLLFTNMQRLLARSFMSLRFQTLVIKNQRVLQAKREKILAIKAFSGWKYQAILDKTYSSYTTLKYKEKLSLHFTSWFNLYKYNSTQKSLLSNIVFKKDITEKKLAFSDWKKKAYRGRLLDLLQVNFTFPHQRYIAGRCLQNWRRFARLNSQKQDTNMIHQCEAMKSSLLARRVLREWYSQVQPNLAARVLGQRLERSVNRLLQVKALYLISVQGVRNEYLQENLTEIVERRENEIKRDFFNKWRRQFAILTLQRVVMLKNQRKMMKNCLTALKLNTEESQIEKQQFTSLGDFVRSVSPHTQISLMRVFGEKGSKIQRDELLRQYFLRFKIGVKNIGKVNTLKKQAQQYYQVRALQKFFLQMVQTFIARHKERTYEEQGFGFWRQQILKKAMWAFVDNTLKQRKLNHARAYFEHKLAQQAIEGLKQEVQLAKRKNQLNTRMMYFLKKKCILIFKLSFTQWRVKFEHKHYGKTAVNEYNNFRNTKLKRMAFDYFVAIIHQRLQIKDMTAKAQNYFYKKEQLKTMHKCFYAIRDHSLTNKHERKQHSQSEMTALKFYAFNLLTTHLRAWKREVRMTRNRQKRSKMYSLFSAWKFYTKERVLLKKYLQECSQVPSEASGLQVSKGRQRSKGGERSGSNRPVMRGNSKGSEQNENVYVNGDGYLSARSNSQNNFNTRKTQAQRLDPNLLTTQEMRDKVARFSNIKSDFVDGLSQEGTPFVAAQDRKILGSNHNVLNSASPSPMTRVGFSAGENRRIENSAGGAAMSGGMQNFNLSNLNRMSNGTYTGFNQSGIGQSHYQDYGAPAFGLASQGDMVNIGAENGGVQFGSNYNSAIQSANGKSPLQNQRATPSTNRGGAYSSGGDRQMSRKYM